MYEDCRKNTIYQILGPKHIHLAELSILLTKKGARGKGVIISGEILLDMWIILKQQKFTEKKTEMVCKISKLFPFFMKASLVTARDLQGRFKWLGMKKKHD